MNDATNKLYTDLTVSKKPGSEVEVVGEISVEVAHVHRMKAVKKLSADLELPGFRKGHVPEDVAMKSIGEEALMQETAELALAAVYAQIVQDEKLDVIGRPNVTITKLAPGNPIGFKITSAVFPELSLPDYKKIAEKERGKHDNPDAVTVTDEDVDNELKRLQGMMAKAGEAADGIDSEKNDAHDSIEKKEGAKVAPPTIDDAFAQKLGDFKNLDDLKEKIKKGLTMDRQQKAHEKRRLAIADAVIAKTTVEVPEVFVEGELDQMFASFEERVKRAGIEMDAYLKQTNKTVEDMRKEWHTDAEKRAKLQLILGEIAKNEDMTPDEQRLEREVGHLKEHYPDAEESAVRSYVGAQLMNEMVFAMLEDRKVPKVGDHDHDHGHEGHDHEHK